jgi:hypothetical protein
MSQTWFVVISMSTRRQQWRFVFVFSPNSLSNYIILHYVLQLHVKVSSLCSCWDSLAWRWRTASLRVGTH